MVPSRGPRRLDSHQVHPRGGLTMRQAGPTDRHSPLHRRRTVLPGRCSAKQGRLRVWHFRARSPGYLEDMSLYEEPGHIAMLRASVRRFVDRELPAERVRDWDANEHFPRDVWD